MQLRLHIRRDISVYNKINKYFQSVDAVLTSQRLSSQFPPLRLICSIDNIVQVGISNSDIISVGTNSLMYGQSSLRFWWTLVTWGYKVTGSESASLYLQTNLQSLETLLVSNKFSYVVIILSSSSTNITVLVLCQSNHSEEVWLQTIVIWPNNE